MKFHALEIITKNSKKKEIPNKQNSNYCLLGKLTEDILEVEMQKSQRAATGMSLRSQQKYKNSRGKKKKNYSRFDGENYKTSWKG